MEAPPVVQMAAATLGDGATVAKHEFSDLSPSGRSSAAQTAARGSPAS
ncbi:hypothetical protein CRG98_049342, partial [Punica granatum]